MNEIQSSPRLLVMVIGHMRTAEQTISHFQANLLDQENVEILVQCPKSDARLAAKTFQSKNTDAWDPSPNLPISLRYAWPLFGDSGRECKQRKPSFYFQLVRQYRAATVFAEYIDMERDWILKWRPDLMLLGQLDWRALTKRPRALWVPKHDNFGGINDQCALGPAKLMLPYLQRLERLDEYYSNGGQIKQEIFLQWALKGLPIERMPLPYCIHRGDFLNGVSMKHFYRDFHDSALIEEFRNAGISVHLDSTPKEVVSSEETRERILRWWQNGLGHCFRAKSLAESAVKKRPKR